MYQKLLGKNDRTEKETKELKGLAQELLDLGYIKNEQRQNTAASLGRVTRARVNGVIFILDDC